MKYYEIWINSLSYKGEEALTYHFDGYLKAGAIVNVPFRNISAMGIVKSDVSKPEFKTKEISSILGLNSLPKPILELIKWLPLYYPAPKSTILHLFLPASLVSYKPKTDNKEELAKTAKIKLPPLTDEQSDAINKINASRDRTIILHGDTGSGKTRVYTETIKKVFSEGKSAIVLTPEIGLTPQLIKTLEMSYPGSVVVIHSGLSVKQRSVNWLRILESDDPLVVVGPRSALFSPLKNVGIIIIDEAHESVYKQEQSPRYQATRVAAKLAELSGAKLILGSATPLISDYYFVKSKPSLVVRMKKPAVGGEQSNHLATIDIVKITDKNQFSRSFWLSDKLLDSVQRSIKNNEQSLIYLNRRGTSLIVHCNNCGWDALCPNCDTNLTYHDDQHLMRCHSCNYSAKAPSRCPVCASDDIIFQGIGTKAIETEIKKLFPMAQVRRFDRDNKTGDKLSENYEELVKGEVDIVIGTQILTKGLDLPHLSTVGVVMADSNLSFPDYTAEEKTFQTLTQVIGRVARGHRAGFVIIQTYNPESAAIKAAVDKDYEGFYKSQIEERKSFLFPPFCYTLKLSSRLSTSLKSQQSAEKLAVNIRSLGLSVVINGPSPAFKEKDKGRYVWQLIIKSKNRPNLIKIVESLSPNTTYDIDPINLL
jgi:primosomal protein N' (replication factor Y)